jgi:hexosaminidase
MASPALRLRLRLLLLLAVAATATARGAGAGRVDLWPMPASVARGAQTLLVSKDLKLSTAGSSYADGKGILKEAFQRMLAVVELDHAINGTYSSHGAPVLAGVRVAVRSPNDEVSAHQLTEF